MNIYFTVLPPEINFLSKVRKRADKREREMNKASLKVLWFDGLRKR